MDLFIISLDKEYFIIILVVEAQLKHMFIKDILPRVIGNVFTELKSLPSIPLASYLVISLECFHKSSSQDTQRSDYDYFCMFKNMKTTKSKLVVVIYRSQAFILQSPGNSGFCSHHRYLDITCNA